MSRTMYNIWSAIIAIFILAFAREQLLQLNEHNITLPRGVRKTLFNLHLWQSRDQRERTQSRWYRMFTSEITAPSLTKSKRLFRQCPSFGLLNTRSVANKSTAIANLIEEGACDVFLVTETWHTASDDTVLWVLLKYVTTISTVVSTVVSTISTAVSKISH